MSRMFQLRTYYANPDRAEALEARFRNHTLRLLEKHGYSIVAFGRLMDQPDAFGCLSVFDSPGAAKEAWDGFVADPEWLAVKAETEVDGPLVEHADEVNVIGTELSPLR